MNDLLIAQELAALLAGGGYSTLRNLFKPEGADAAQIYAAQDATDLARPTLTINGSGWEPYGSRRKGVLVFEIRSRMGSEADDEHQHRFEALYAALLGVQGASESGTLANMASAKAALKTAVAARTKATIIDYGPARENTLEATFDGVDLMTTLRLAMAWQFTPSV